MYRSFNPRPIPLDKNRLRQLVDDLFSKWRQKLKKLRSADKSVGRRSNVSLDFELKSVKGIIKKGQLRLMGASKPTGSGKVTQWSSLFGLGAFFIGSAEQSRRYLGVKIDAVEKGRFLIALPFNNKWTPTKILHKMAQDPAFIEQQKHKLFSYMIHEISHAKDIFTHNKEKERYEDLYRLKGLRYKKRPIRPVRQPTGLYNLRGEKIYFTMTTKGGWQEILDRFPAAQVYKLKARGYGFKQIAESLSYYNEPWEVRAYMQQIVHEVNSYMQKAKKRGEENHFLMKDFEAAFSDLIFQTSFWPQMSKTWKDKEKWFTAQNKKYILDSIVQNLQESKLVPDRRKGKKPFKKKPKPTRAYRKPTKRPPILPLDQCMGLKMVANPVQMTEYSIQKDDTFGGVIIVKKVPLKPARFPWSKWEEVEHVDTVEQAKKKIARYYADEKKERQRKSDAEITRRQREALRSMDLFGMYEEELSKPPASLGTTSRGKKITTAFRRQSNVGAFTPMYSHHSSKDYAYFQQFFKSFTAGDHKEAAKAHREAEKDQKEAERGARNMASRYRGSPTGREWSLRRSLHDRMADHHVGMKQSHEAEAKGKGKGKIQQKLFNPSLKVGDKIQEGNRKGTVKSLRSKGTVDVLFDDMDYVIRRQLGSVKRINPRQENRKGIGQYQYHATSWDRLPTILKKGLQLPRSQKDVSTFVHDIPSLSTADKLDDAIPYHPRGAWLKLKVKKGAKYWKRSLVRHRKKSDKNLLDTVNRFAREALAKGYDGIHVAEWQSSVGNQTYNPDVLEVVEVINIDDKPNPRRSNTPLSRCMKPEKPILILGCGRPKQKGKDVMVRDLYLKGFWNIYRNAVSQIPHPHLDVYVMSAKYGLLPETAMVCDYDMVLVDKKSNLDSHEIYYKNLTPTLKAQLKKYKWGKRPVITVLGKPYQAALREAGVNFISADTHPDFPNRHGRGGVGKYNQALGWFLSAHSPKKSNPRRKNKGQESQLEDIWYDWMIQGKKPALRKGYLSVRELEPFREYSRFELRNSPRTKHYRQLKENIAQRGVQEPIGLILGSNGHAYIGEGNHRHEIAKDLGITHLPVELHFWQEPTSNGGANWSAWYKEDGDVDENDLINEILTDLRLNPQNILIPPPPIEKKRIAELKKIQKQYKNRVVPDHLQKRLDEKVGDTFDDFLRSEGYRSQRAQIKKWNNGIIQQIMLHKNHYGAERPHQLAKRKGIPFQYDKLKTARTPSYPSGHTTQAYFLAMKLSQQHPELKGRLFNLANMVAESRIDRGVHFPSDNKAGMALAQQVFAGDTRKSNPFTPKEKKLIQKIQRVIETRPQLLKEPYRSKVQKGAHPHTGHCYVASQALYSLLGAKKAGYSPLCMQHEGGSHWAILREKDGAILDPTVAQFKTIPDYSKGVRKGYCHPKQKDKSGCFLPDARTRKLLGWMK